MRFVHLLKGTFLSAELSMYSICGWKAAVCESDIVECVYLSVCLSVAALVDNMVVRADRTLLNALYTVLHAALCSQSPISPPRLLYTLLMTDIISAIFYWQL